MICRLIAPDWLYPKGHSKKVLEGEFTDSQVLEFNKEGYNVYYWPNSPMYLPETGNVNGAHINRFDFCFVDFDCKSKTYASKEDFLEAVGVSGIEPSMAVDSGNGIHVYWRVADLDAKSYLRLTRRLIRLYNTDTATNNIAQLMRVPGTNNTKIKDAFIKCEIIFESNKAYTCEDLNNVLPAITLEDETWCQQHYDRTYKTGVVVEIDETLPPKFGKLLTDSQEAKDIWSGSTDDRSKGDYRLAHIMFATSFTKDEAMSVLVNSAKAMTRAPIHRVSYAQNIVDKIWTFEQNPDLNLSESVENILKRGDDAIQGTPLRCHKRIDNTARGFRIGDVIGLVGGSGIGKTAFGLNMFKWFLDANPEYHHFFIPLEQPSNEIAQRWSNICSGGHALNGKVHVISNYDADGNFRHLSFDEIRDYIQKWEKSTGNKVGCVMIDHIGALKKKGNNDENQDLMTICHNMKAFAVQTKTLLVMQSQTTREKAGIGDLELNKDAAYGTSTFEWYCDYLITIWQPAKRCHSEPACPTVTAFKYCKIRHKKPRQDVIQEDVPYYMYFDSDKETLRDITQEEETSFRFFLNKATNKRKADNKTDLVEYKSVPYIKDEDETTTIRH